MTSRLLLVLLFSLPLFAQDSFVADPPRPYEGEAVAVRIGGFWPSGAPPHAPHVSIEGNVITIDLQASLSGATVMTPWGERVRLGRLPGGTYTVLVRNPELPPSSHTLVVHERPFVVAPRSGGFGTEVMLEGVFFEDCPLVECEGLSVTFGGVASPAVEVTTSGTIVAAVPPGSGEVDVTVRIEDDAITFPAGFRYGEPMEDDFVRVLFPVTFAGPGAHGSEWRSLNMVRNDAPVAADTRPLIWEDRITPTIPIPAPIPPGERADMPQRNRDGGDFLRVPRGMEHHFSYASHAVDLSRSDSDRGTEIQVVQDEDTAALVRILDVPLTESYRAMLRIFNLDLANGRLIEIAVRREGALVRYVYATLSNAAEQPSFAAVDLSAIPELRGAGTVDLSIRPATFSTNDARLWAFVTVTNNETQHVTTYSPQ